MVLLAISPAWSGPAEDRELIGQLDREVIALHQKLDRMQTLLASCATSIDPTPLYGELVSVLQGQPATVRRLETGAAVTVPMDTLFSPDSTGLREEAGPVLDLLSTAFRVHPELRVTVEAYADNGTIPSPLRKLWPTAWELTAARAAAVTRVLVDRFSIPASQLVAAAHGDQDPVSTNDTPEGRQLNRRLVFTLQPRATP